MSTGAALANVGCSVVVEPPPRGGDRWFSTIRGAGPVRFTDWFAGSFTWPPWIVTDAAPSAVTFVSWSPFGELLDSDKNTPAVLPAGSGWFTGGRSTKALLPVIPAPEDEVGVAYAPKAAGWYSSVGAS